MVARLQNYCRNHIDKGRIKPSAAPSIESRLRMHRFGSAPAHAVYNLRDSRTQPGKLLEALTKRKTKGN